ncbi:MAG: hypothetical protein JW802_08420 [Campylobacterales bacterium]|nr:hypothetical protein [Campylobacterales bacterium]MBN2832381.1 hypothetical protein [Campylobacterales bacterium]
MALLKPFLVLLLSTTLSLAQTPEQELIARVFHLLSIEGKPLRIYEHMPLISLKGSSFVSLVETCEEANVVYGSAFETLPASCAQLPRFSTDYDDFKTTRNSIGAFYWRKGRPQLRFYQEACERFGITLPVELQHYAQ